MRSMHSIRRACGRALALPLVVSLAILAVGCGGGGDAKQPSAPDIVTRAVTATQAENRFHFVFDEKNGPASSKGVHLVFAEGDIIVPATVKADATGTLAGVPLRTLRGGSGTIGRTEFTLLGIRRARAQLREIERSPDPAVAAKARELDTFMGQLQGAVGQVGSFLRATANPIELRQDEGGGRTWLLSAQVQGYALALAVAFVTVLLGAGALVAEREENVLGRLARGLVGLGQLVVEKVAFVALVGTGMGLVLALVFGVIVELGGVSGGEPWLRLPLLLLGLVLAALAFGSFGVMIGALAREAATASVVALLVALPLMLLALVPAGSIEAAAWIGALFPFGHAQAALSAALYDEQPAGTLSREGAWLLGLALAYGSGARVAARRMLG